MKGRQQQGLGRGGVHVDTTIVRVFLLDFFGDGLIKMLVFNEKQD